MSSLGIRANGVANAANSNSSSSTSSVPTLKVMRIQAPELARMSTPSPSCPHLSSSLVLPDSFGVIHIGETFTAYLGALNVHDTKYVTNLSIVATLQTPTRRWNMPSALENKPPTTAQDFELRNFSPLNIAPNNGVDAVVSRPLEETGQHILRVEVSYGGPADYLSQANSLNGDTPSGSSSNSASATNSRSNPRKTLRKFYRFHVSSPLNIRELTLRGGESTCFVSLAVENTAPAENKTSAAGGASSSSGGLTISQTAFHPYTGLLANRIKPVGINTGKSSTKKTAVELYDECGRLNPGESKRYMFEVKAASENAAIRGIAKGDELGKAIVTWRKAMGEAGRIASTYVYCPPSAATNTNEEKKDGMSSVAGSGSVSSGKHGQSSSSSGDEDDRFVVHGSGLSVDVAAASASRSASHAPSEIPNVRPLDDIYPVTVESINPPSKMTIGDPIDLQLLIVNHGTKKLNLQLQMRLPQMKGVVITGQSFKNLGEIAPNGGSVISKIQIMAMLPGLFFAKGCFVVDLNSGMEIKQPNLFSVFVDIDDKDSSRSNSN